MLGAFIYFSIHRFPLIHSSFVRSVSPPLTTPVTISVRVSLIRLQSGGTTVEPGLMSAGATSNNIHQTTETPETNQTLQKDVDHMANLKFRTLWFSFDHTTVIFSTSYWKTLHLDCCDPSLDRMCVDQSAALKETGAAAWVGIKTGSCR